MVAWSDCDVSRRTVLRGALGVLALSSLPALASCHSSSSDSGTGGIAGLHPISVGLARENVPLAGAANLAEVVAGMRTFGAGLYRDGATVASNWTVSPLSIDVAFGMLRAGCRGSSASEIDRVFGYPAGSAAQGSQNGALNSLTAHLATNQPVPVGKTKASAGTPAANPVVAIANGLFLDRKFAGEVDRAFLKTLATQYGASPTAVNFTDPSSAATAINSWVSRQTRGRISKLFDSLDPSTLLVLANAVYLKAAWFSPFSASMTTAGPFTTAKGKRVTAHLMRQSYAGGAPYAAGPGWQRVTVPYVGGELTMRIVVPDGHASDTATLGRALTAATAPSLKDGNRPVDLTLPRWDAATDLPLVPILSRLGMPDVFSPQKANLTGIASGLFVDAAIHRANITVDELGTEAAAVTGIGIAASGISGTPVAVRADRPFAWAIVHEPTGTPIFTGHVVDPTAAAGH